MSLDEREDSRSSSTILQSKGSYSQNEPKGSKLPLGPGHHLYKSDVGKIDLYKPDRTMSSISKNGIKSNSNY